MSEQFGKIQELLVSMVSDTASSMIDFAPKLVGALIVFLLGWILARIVRALIDRSIRGVLEALLDRIGVGEALERAPVTATPSEIVANVAYWLVLILALMASSEILGLTAVSDAISRIFAYIPTVISAALVLAAGVFLARFVGSVVTSGATAADLSYAKGLGAVASTSILVMVGVVTIEQLGIDTQILTTVISVSVAAIAAGMGLAFALGAKEVVRGILAGHYLRQSLPEGRAVEVDGRRGVVELVGPVSTTFRDGERRYTIPNSYLVEQVIQE